MDTNLDRILLESKIRAENKRAAILLGLFGSTKTDIIKNLESLEKEAEKAVHELETALLITRRR